MSRRAKAGCIALGALLTIPALALRIVGAPELPVFRLPARR